MNVIKVRRKVVAEILDLIRRDLALRVPPEVIEGRLSLTRGAYGIPLAPAVEPLELCQGNAHSNAHIDNCGLCAPRWGFTGPKVECK